MVNISTKSLVLTGIIILLPLLSFAQDLDLSIKQCMIERLENADDSVTIAQLQVLCREALHGTQHETINNTRDKTINAKKNENRLQKATGKLQQHVISSSKEGASNRPSEPGVISARMRQEERTEFDPYVITPHRLNYVLPALTTNRINTQPFSSLEGYEENLDDVETKFQLSVKIPLNAKDLYVEGDGLYFGFTLEAWWQVYSDNISKPFRETNYRPELFYVLPLNWHPYSGNTVLSLGIEHQSNGRDQLLSRSWNRIYANFLYEIDNVAVNFKPWWRIPEDDKEFPLDSDGDDNPDISDFMGHFELGGAYKWNNCEMFIKGRRNFETNKGAVELGFTFPLWKKLRGYTSVFDGYGESLIDYNYRQTRFGVGIALTNIL